MTAADGASSADGPFVVQHWMFAAVMWEVDTALVRELKNNYILKITCPSDEHMKLRRDWAGQMFGSSSTS